MSQTSIKPCRHLEGCRDHLLLLGTRNGISRVVKLIVVK